LEIVNHVSQQLKLVAINTVSQLIFVAFIRLNRAVTPNESKLSHSHWQQAQPCNDDIQISCLGQNWTGGGCWLQRVVRHTTSASNLPLRSRLSIIISPKALKWLSGIFIKPDSDQSGFDSVQRSRIMRSQEPKPALAEIKKCLDCSTARKFHATLASDKQKPGLKSPATTVCLTIQS
jgi:hypothetical protein